MSGTSLTACEIPDARNHMAMAESTCMNGNAAIAKSRPSKPRFWSGNPDGIPLVGGAKDSRSRAENEKKPPGVESGGKREAAWFRLRF
jgi:hypothetical protein